VPPPSEKEHSAATRVQARDKEEPFKKRLTECTMRRSLALAELKAAAETGALRSRPTSSVLRALEVRRCDIEIRVLEKKIGP
jgi:hypothetical protein